MRHSSFRQRYPPGRRGTSRLLRCEPLEHRWLLSITVDTLIDEADGSIGDGDISLRDAIAAADSGETIDFDASLDGGTILLTLGELSITQAMTLEATALENGLTIDASGNDPTPGENNGDGSRVFNINDNDDGTSSPVTISGLTLTGGDANERGGAIRTREVLAVINSTISENSARGDGGGIYGTGDVTVTSSTISGNSAEGNGGGIYGAGDVSLTNSSVHENVASDMGGGINVIGSSATVSLKSSTISGNSAERGGGLVAYWDGGVTISNSTISGNSATQDGGGILAVETIVRVAHSTITSNSAGTRGGGVQMIGLTSVSLSHSIAAENTDNSTGPDLRVSEWWPTGIQVGDSLIGDSTGTGLAEAPIGMPDANGNLIGGPEGGIINPMLDPLDHNGGSTETHALLPGSPAIDAGDPFFSPPPEHDQRGITRVIDGDEDGTARVDMGAFELLPLILGDCNLDASVDGLDVHPFVDVLLNGTDDFMVSVRADMNTDTVINGLDVDRFVAAVVGGGNAAGIAAVSLLNGDVATENGQLGVPMDRRATSPTTERSSARLLRARHVHDGDDHSQLVHHRAVERVMGRRLRLGGDGHRSPQRGMVHQLAGDWQASVERVFGDGADGIG